MVMFLHYTGRPIYRRFSNWALSDWTWDWVSLKPFAYRRGPNPSPQQWCGRRLWWRQWWGSYFLLVFFKIYFVSIFRIWALTRKWVHQHLQAMKARLSFTLGSGVCLRRFPFCKRSDNFLCHKTRKTLRLFPHRFGLPLTQFTTKSHQIRLLLLPLHWPCQVHQQKAPQPQLI